MLRRIPLLAAAALALGFAPAPRPRTNDSRADLRQMQGAWARTAFTVDGKPLPGEAHIRVEGDRLKYLSQGKVSCEYALTLEAGASPKRYTSRGVGGPVAGLEFRGIYSVEGG